MNTNCFAYNENGCIVLKKNMCEKGRCPFYKTQAQVDLENNKTRLRLKKLGLPINIYVDTTNKNFEKE